VAAERAAFLRAALQAEDEKATFCMVLTLTGARVSEVFALTHARIDEAAGTINIETLKRRKKGIVRAITVPRELFLRLNMVHQFRKAPQSQDGTRTRLWS